MIRTEVDKRYLVNKRGRKIYVELRRSSDGKVFIVIEKTLKHVFMKNDEEMIWEQDTKNAEEIDYEKLPEEVRKALSEVTGY